jgi:glutamine amidotransferase-like uncharacterized protein
VKKITRLFSFLILLCIVAFLTQCEKNPAKGYISYQLSFDSVYAGLYIDDAVWATCRTQTIKILDETGIAYEIINIDSILQGDLAHFSVLIMPGGRPDLYRENLGSEGIDRINNYVSMGGGYIGICGGAFLAAEKNIWRGWAGESRVYYEDNDLLGIFKGTADGPSEDFAPSYRDEKCKIKIINKQHPAVADLTDTIEYYYDHGPVLFPDDDTHATILGKSVKGENNFIITFQYNYGRIFLSSGHPEITNSADCRKIFANAVKWCSKAE